jgi:hypothetical protein
MLTNQMNSDRDHLTREARDLSEMLARFAKDVDAGISTGLINRALQGMVQLGERAAIFQATTHAVELYETERALDQASPKEG